MSERVTQWDIGVRWDPNDPDAALIITGAGSAVLAMNPHADDVNKDCVVLTWSGVRAASAGPPNDEARAGHPLYRLGLSEIMWAGVVQDSAWIVGLERQNQVHPRHDPARFSRLVHYIVPLKENTAEVIAEASAVLRRPGPTLRAAALSL